MDSKTTGRSNNIIAILALLGIIISIDYSFPISIETKLFLGYHKDSVLNFTELTSKYGYKTDEHTVVTEDGYILTIFRILKGKKCHGEKKKPPVILMHGLIQSSDAWIDAGPDDGLAYLIADACYDIWVGNVRGNTYSRRHVSMDPDKDAKFWQFSVDENGFYDIPATIDYVLKHTEADKVNYIGFSQGTTIFFIMCSERRDYCDKVNAMIALAPAAHIKFVKSVAIKSIMKAVSNLEGVLSRFGSLELFSRGSLTQEFLSFFCHFGDITETMCHSIVTLLDSSHPGSISSKTIRIASGHIPAGTSAHNLAWFDQSTRGNFTKFDYGKNVNLDLYGSETPPKYSLSAVTVPVLIVYGMNDYVVDEISIEWLKERLPNVVECRNVSDPLWNHFDFSYSQFISELLFDTVNEYLSMYSYV